LITWFSVNGFVSSLNVFFFRLGFVVCVVYGVGVCEFLSVVFNMLGYERGCSLSTMEVYEGGRGQKAILSYTIQTFLERRRTTHGTHSFVLPFPFGGVAP